MNATFDCLAIGHRFQYLAFKKCIIIIVINITPVLHVSVTVVGDYDIGCTWYHMFFKL